MTDRPESILRSAIRSFIVTLCIGFGIVVLFIPIFLIIGGVSSLKEEMPKREFKEKILPDAEGKRSFLAAKKPRILQVNIHGIIGTEKLNASKIREMLVESREGDLKNNQVKAIFLSINTPGGTVVDANGIYHALKSYKEQYKVPIYAFVDGLCASGGMYVALAADKIYATEASVVGSVGVILSTFPNFADALDKIGIFTETISAGKGKDAMNPFRKWKKGEANNFEMLTDYFYQQFVDLVVANRPRMSKEKLINDYGAHVFPASIAEEHGYIDVSNSSRKNALTDLVKASGIVGKYQVVALEKENWLENLFHSESSIFSGKVEHSFRLNTSLPPEFENKLLYYYQPPL